MTVGEPPLTLIGRLSRADWLDRERIVAWGAILLSVETAFLGFLVLWHHQIFGPVDPPASTDFVSFYAAGKLALAGTPALAYDRAAHAAAEAAATVPHAPYQFFFYPPVYLLLCAALARLPYFAAFYAFQAFSLVAWLSMMKRVLDARDIAWCLPVLAYPAVFWTLGLGQNAFLTAALLGSMTLLVDRRPIAAGILLGLLCYKPHLALLAPIVLAAGGHWRTFAAAAVTVAVAVGLSLALFGVETWDAYVGALAGAQTVYEDGGIDLSGLVTPYGAARVFGATSNIGWVVQLATTALTIVIVSWIWRRAPGAPERFIALAAGILLSIPLSLVYDLMLLTVAMGWLIRLGRGGGFGPWEKLALLFCFIVPLISRDLGRDLHIAVAPLAPAALIALCVVRTRHRIHQADAKGARSDSVPIDCGVRSSMETA